MYTGTVTMEEPRWLTDEEQQAWRAFLTACQTLFTAIDWQLAHESHIAHGYYEILVRLSETPGRALRMSQLAEASTSSKSRLSHAVARLEERGWVERSCSQEDRRGQIAWLTDEGYAAIVAAAPGHVRQVRRSLIDVLTPEQIKQLHEISTAIIEAAALECASRSDAAASVTAAACDDAETACDDAAASDEAETACDEADSLAARPLN